MGWSGGSSMFAEVWKSVKPYIPVERREKVLRELYEAFKEGDWDTEDEVDDADWQRVWAKIRKERGWDD